MTEFVENGHNGFVFMRGDRIDLKRVLEHVSSNPDLAVEMSRNTVYPKGTAEMTEEVVDIYKHVLLHGV
jgi:hypothetical protein